MLVTLKNVYKIYGEGLESEVRALDGVSLYWCWNSKNFHSEQD